MSKVVSTKTNVIRYLVGFGLALTLTVIAFGLVMYQVGGEQKAFSDSFIVFAIVALAVIQLIVQLTFFLHLGQEFRPRWNIANFLFMLLVLLIIVLGSLWIMDNLNYNMMSPTETKEYLDEHPGSF